MQMESLQELLVHEMRDIFSAENQMLKSLPRMAKKAKNPKLKQAFENHLRETEDQIEKLRRLFEGLGEKPTGKKCLAMEGLINEAKETMGEDMDDDVMDAALIAAAQKVEHYEIASYGTCRTWAELMGMNDVARVLQQILDQEGKTDKLLTQLAESEINIDAEEPEEEEANA